MPLNSLSTCELRNVSENYDKAGRTLLQGRVSTGSHRRYWVPNITSLTTATLLPSCFLSTQEVASARGVGGGVCEDVSGKRERAWGRTLPLYHPGAWHLDRDRRPDQGHQRPYTGRAEEDCLGWTGPPVVTVVCTKPCTSNSNNFIFILGLKKCNCTQWNFWILK